MTKITSDALDAIEAMADFDYDSDSPVRRAYSGRGMYGESCVAIVGNISDLVRFVDTLVREAVLRAEVYEEDDSGIVNFADRVADVRQDSMGLRSVYYWPGVQVKS